MTFAMRLFAAVFAPITFGYLFGYLTGCELPVHVKEVTAETTFLAQQLRCVDAYSRKEEIDSCRARLRAHWGLDAGTREGGLK